MAEMFLRAYPLEDIRILSRAQGSEYADGRTVEAFTAVFNRQAEIVDGQGHYLEEIDPAAFDRAIDHARPQGSRSRWNVGVFYNHGLTLHGTPSDRGSVPLGSPVEIRVERSGDLMGLLTVTRYNTAPLADEILESIRSGDITGHSFTGRMIRSDPARPPAGGFKPGRSGDLRVVRRLELGLREYGPTPFPAYVDTAVVGVRAMLAGLLPGLTLSATPSDEPSEEDEAARVDSEAADTPDEASGPVADDPPPDGEHSTRHALLQRIAAAKIKWPDLARDPRADQRAQRVAELVGPEGDGSE